MAGTTAQKTILILGASFAGISSAHYFLKHTYPSLPDKESYRVLLVGESEKFYCRPASPLVIVNPKLLPQEKVYFDILPGFKSYTKEQFAFTQATATALDPASKTVTLSLPSGETQSVTYHALIIATGTHTPSPILGLHGDYKFTQEAQTAFASALPTANTIVIAGGGPAGVECAGEIAEHLNGKPGFFGGKVAAKVKITLVTSDSKLLPLLPAHLAKQAQALLEARGVEVLYNTRVESVIPEGAGVLDTISSVTGNATVKLSTGETREADLYLPATGVTPNTSFLPKTLLDERGYVRTHAQTLRLDDPAHALVYAVGDVGNYTPGGVLDIFGAVPIAGRNLKRDLLGDKATGEDAIYKTAQNPAKPTHLVPIGRSKGIGMFNGNKLPSLMVWMIKGRDYFASGTPQIVDGRRVAKP